MPAKYIVRLMFEWGGGCLWSGDAAAHAAYGEGAIEDRLPLSVPTLRRLEEMTTWHDQSLDWAYPPDPSPWTPEEEQRFEAAAGELLADLRVELGSDFDVVYQPLRGGQ